MRIVCSFPDCRSGSVTDQRNSKLHGLKKKKMFKFPHRNVFPLIREKWEDVIGRRAEDNEVLCELHFRVEDFKKKYEIFLTNGSRRTIGRGIIILNPTAVPQDNSKEKSEPGTSLEEINLNQEVQREPIILDKLIKKEEIHLESMDTSTTLPLKSYSDTNKSFSLKILNHDLEQIKLPEGWSHLKLTFSRHEAILVGYWYANRPAQKEFVIHADGSIEVFIRKNLVSIPDIKPGTTINNIIYNIQVLQKVLFCDGIGMAERYSSLCKGYVMPTQTFFMYGHTRCEFCKKLRIKRTRQQKKKLIKSTKDEVKRQKFKDTAKNEKAKNKRMQVKLMKLEAEVARLKKRNVEKQL